LEELKKELANLMFNYYFKEKNENEIWIKPDFEVKKYQRSASTLKDDIYSWIYTYLDFLMHSSHSIFMNEKLTKELKKLFKYGEIPFVAGFGLLASHSYGLIEYRDRTYNLSNNIIGTLKKFRYDSKHRNQMKFLPPLETEETEVVA